MRKRGRLLLRCTPDLLESPTRRRRLSPGVVLLGATLLLLFLLMAAMGVGWLSARQRVRAELERIYAAGEPVTADHLDAFYLDPPADRDATQLWLEAIEALDTPELRSNGTDSPLVLDANELLPVDTPWPEMSAVEQLLDKYQEPLAKMHRAAKFGGTARYPVNFGGGAMQLPHLPQLRGAVGLLALEAEVAARRHNARAVAETLGTIFAAARSLEDEPTLVSQLVRLAIDSLARGQLERHLPDIQFSDGDLAAIDRQLAADDYSTSFHRAMLGARAESLKYFDNPALLGASAPSSVSAVFRPGDQIVYLKSMEKFIAAFEFNGPALRDAIDDAENQVRQFANEPLARVRYPISFAILPAIDPYPEAVDRGIAYRDSSRVALAIERFRLRHHELPQMLDALVPEFMPEVPLDPFDGQPLRYRVEATEYKVYSIGGDGIDQGGQTVTLPQASGRSLEDLVFRVRLSGEPTAAKKDGE